MEDHVGRLLSAIAAVILAGLALWSLGRATRADEASVEWALVATLTGAGAALAALASRGRGLRALSLPAGLAGAAIALGLLGQAAWQIGRAFVTGGPARTLTR